MRVSVSGNKQKGKPMKIDGALDDLIIRCFENSTLKKTKKNRALYKTFCGQEGQAMYVLLAETGKQSYFSHLHSCVHPR